MRKIILNLAISLDGFIEGPNGEIDWCILEEDMNFEGFLNEVDAIFYGRKSYDAWGNFQPEATADAAEKEVWKAVHSKKKYVFSRKEKAAEDAIYISKDIGEAVTKIKNLEGAAIWLYGGASLIRSFLQLGLIDEFRLYVHPVALGKGKPLFENPDQRTNLKLLSCQSFRSGVVELIYQHAST